MMEKLAEKIADIIWAKLENKIVTACEEGYKRGQTFGYIEGHEDGGISATDDLIRRVTFLYDAVYDSATKDAYAEAGAIPIDEIDAETFERLGAS